MNYNLIFVGLFLLINWNFNLYDCQCDIDQPQSDEGKLRKKILCNYDKGVRPTKADEATLIFFRMILKGFNFDDVESTISIYSWISMKWHDDHLQWQPDEYKNIKSIILDSDTIWNPDFSIYNSDTVTGENDLCKRTQCLISSSGSVSCIPPCYQTARCTSDYTRYPFDVQECRLHMGSWMNSGQEIDFQVDSTDITETYLDSQNRQWRLIGASYKRLIGNYSKSTVTHPSLIYSFVIQRHSPVHAALFLVPALVFIIMNLGSLWLDPQSTERLFLICLNILLHITVLQQLIWLLPGNGDLAPSIVLYFRDSSFLCGLLLINTFVVRGISKSNLKIPKWLKSRIVYLHSKNISLFPNYLNDKEPLNNNMMGDIDIENSITDHNAETVTSTSSTLPDSSSQPPKKPSIRNNLTIIIDRILFAIIFVIYIILVIAMIPEGYTNGTTTPTTIKITESS